MPRLWGFLTRKYARVIVLLSGSLRKTRLSGKFETAVKSGFFMGKFEKMAKTKDEYLADFKKWGLLGGRPRAFKSPKDMAERIAAFLEACESRMVDKVTKNGVVTANIPAPTTVEDFCTFAGITKTTFYDYGDKPAFKPLVDYYKQIVEAYWVRQCAEGIAGNKADFILKNAFEGNWKEKSDVTMTLKQALVGYEGEENGNREGHNTDPV